MASERTEDGALATLCINTIQKKHSAYFKRVSFGFTRRMSEIL